jgi:hypothetical protein
MIDALGLNDLSTVAMVRARTAAPNASQGPARVSHRKPRSPWLWAALWGALALFAVLLAVSLHVYGYGHALNGGFYWHTPGTPAGWTVGYETYGPAGPGFFGPDAN